MDPGPIAILGGTFDPVHNAHLRIAALALDTLGAARVLWIPTGAPGYRTAPVAPAGHRAAMLRLALGAEPRYGVDERELAPGASGYTVDTLSALRREAGPRTALVLLMGADQFASLDRWHRWRELTALTHIAVFARPGAIPQAAAPVLAEAAARRTEPDGDWRARPAGAIIPVPMPPLDISATGLRERLLRGEDISDLVPEAVGRYIAAHGLYRAAPQPATHRTA